ncbi:MAG TPA: TonB-dependent receptor [Chitinophagaceae bacterium]|nr:TonB-dependent receptor [Chitinophagaceae bacterium]
MIFSKKLFVFSSLLFCFLNVWAQKQTITGKITDINGEALPGVSVKIKSSGAGTSTDDAGVYKIQALPTDVLEFTIVGYQSQKININGRSNINVTMQPIQTELSEVVFIGTRGGGRAKIETAVPVDIIRINQVGLPTAKTDLTSVLNISAPSFNYNKQSGADGADHIDLGTLRGLSPDHTLVLINGKRRHPTAFVGLFGTRGRGSSGVDMNGFPQASVDRLEILRDGASAQYGSDAIAGVINIILKKDINALSMNAGWSGYWDTKFNARKFNAGNQYYSAGPVDGNTFTFSFNNGNAIGKNGGFINYSVNFLTQGKTYRQADTVNWATNKNSLQYINTSRRAFGDASLTTVGGIYNMEIPTSSSKKTSFYSFGGYNYKASDAFAYSRNWSARPERFPVDDQGNRIDVPSILRTATDGEVYYNPHIQTHITDVSFAAGLKGTTTNNWNWDLSNNIGYNNFHYYGDKTFNASLIGQSTPNHFDDGGFNLLQNTLNLDFNKSIKSVGEGLNLGLGAEFRYERYTIYAGEEKSYKGYSPNPLYYPNVDEDRQPASGSQGFPGFSNTDEVKADRTNIAAYADAALDVTKAWLVDAAVRIENYSDFGFVSTVKLATRVKATNNFNIRGSVSTGFRAPSLAQINFSNTLTSFSNGQLVQSLIAPNTSQITKAAGIPDLKEEKSVNASIGFAWKPVKQFTLTIDGYLVKVKDRVVLSGLFSKDDPTLSPAFTSQFPAEVSTAQFFANAVNTTNYGLDIVADYSTKWENKSLRILLAGNIQNLEIDAIHVPPALNDTKLHQKTFYSDREEAFLKASAPKEKFSLGVDYTVNKIGFGAHFTYFGKIVLLGFGDGESPSGDNPNYSGINPQVPTDADPDVYVPEVFNYNPKITTDIYASYKFSKKISLFIGADNLFNVHPDLGVNPLAKGWQTDNESGGAWDSVQMGFNGRRLFTKVAFNF